MLGQAFSRTLPRGSPAGCGSCSCWGPHQQRCAPPRCRWQRVPGHIGCHQPSRPACRLVRPQWDQAQQPQGQRHVRKTGPVPSGAYRRCHVAGTRAWSHLHIQRHIAASGQGVWQALHMEVKGVSPAGRCSPLPSGVVCLCPRRSAAAMASGAAAGPEAPGTEGAAVAGSGMSVPLLAS